MWMSALGGEVVYQADLPACCSRESRGADEDFECLSCGAMWQAAEAPEPEGCAFVAEKEQRGAA